MFSATFPSPSTHPSVTLSSLSGELDPTPSPALPSSLPATLAPGLTSLPVVVRTRASSVRLSPSLPASQDLMPFLYSQPSHQRHQPRLLLVRGPFLSCENMLTWSCSCGVPGHCEKGMFGILNPPNADVSTSTAASANSSMTVQDYVMSAAQTVSSLPSLFA